MPDTHETNPSDARPIDGVFPVDPFPILLDGELVPGNGPVMDIVAPHDRAVVGHFTTPDRDQVDAAVAAARAAVDGGDWSKCSARDRSNLLLRLSELLTENRDELAMLDAVDGGKPISGVYDSDLAVSLESLQYFADRTRYQTGSAIETGDPAVHHRERLQPVGAVLEILPWNGPLWTGVQRVAAILAGGNAAVLKPAALASASLLRFAQLVVEAGFPRGAVQVLPGRGSVIGEQLIHHPGIDMVSLTGGIETGEHVLEATAQSVKRTSVELGGKNPSVVFGDADLDAAAMWSAIGAFANAGQVCVCASRILVQETVFDAFLEKFASFASSMSVGDPRDSDSQLGPVNGQAQFDKSWKYIEIGKRDARTVLGGEPYTDPERAAGWYVPPTIFVDVPGGSALLSEEIFGPVVTVQKFVSEQQAVSMANDTPYGLSAGVFSTNLGCVGRVTDSISAGQIYVNQWFPSGGVAITSEGIKGSGYGGTGMEKYLVRKNIFTRLP